jgi:hypothetical protein
MMLSEDRILDIGGGRHLNRILVNTQARPRFGARFLVQIRVRYLGLSYA